jgi:hypothetical protein
MDVGGMVTNKEVENAAIAWVIERERAAGREAVDVRKARGPADISSPPRLIEVKSSGRWMGSLPMEESQVEEALRNPNFYVHVVENVAEGDTSRFVLTVLNRERVCKLLERAKVYRTYWVSWRAHDYDSTQGDL